MKDYETTRRWLQCAVNKLDLAIEGKLGTIPVAIQSIRHECNMLEEA